MNILKPDFNNNMLKYYHKSAPLLIPSIVMSYAGYKLESKPLYCLSTVVMAPMMSFHSYISVSSVITDYVKPKNIAKICRTNNLSIHALATIGLYRHIYTQLI